MACSACGAPLHSVGVCPRLVAQRRKEGDAEAALHARLREVEARVARLEEAAREYIAAMDETWGTTVRDGYLEKLRAVVEEE